MRSRIWVLIALLVVVLAGAACGGTAQTGATPTPVRVARAPRPTFTVTPTKAEAQPATQAPEPTQAATLVLSPTITPTVAAAATSAPAAAAFTVNNPTVNVRQAGGAVAKEYAVLDFFRQHRDMKPQGIAELNAGGQKLAQALAEEVAATSDALRSEEDNHA